MSTYPKLPEKGARSHGTVEGPGAPCSPGRWLRWLRWLRMVRAVAVEAWSLRKLSAHEIRARTNDPAYMRRAARKCIVNARGGPVRVQMVSVEIDDEAAAALRPILEAIESFDRAEREYENRTPLPPPGVIQ